MEYKTYLQMKTKIQRDLDLEAEDFIQPTEMLEYFNDAINEAETTIHKLGRDNEYFRNSANLALVQGETDVSLPSDIYANKIKAIIYDTTANSFEIKELRSRNLFLDIASIDRNETNAVPKYQYILKNPSASGGVKLRLIPSAKETSSTNVTIWYIRNMQKMVDDTSICDIPEFYNFIWAFVKWRCRDKEQHPGTPDALAELNAQRMLMAETLAPMVDDDNNELEVDFSHYEESV